MVKKPPAPREQREIPEFKSIAEEAEFWDAHDTADFDDSFQPIKVRFSRGLSQASRSGLMRKP
ncbi:MAG TPA: CopG family antitoxin [Dehalococcoidia bacterium]|nr:CopG family antitoxin [Dehalococcoidia bacterium]